MKKGDLIVLAIIVVISLGLLLFNGYRNQNDEPIKVEVRVNGDVVDSFPLNEDIEKVYNTEFGFNKLVISDLIASVTDADCRDQICVKAKDGISHGDAIVCVPNRFTVELIGNDGGDIDAIAR